MSFMRMITFCILSTVLFLPDLSLHSGLCCHKSFCLSVCLSVTLVHLTQGVEPFGNISSPLCTLATLWPLYKILRTSSQGNFSSKVLNARGVAKYSDFGPIEGYISW